MHRDTLDDVIRDVRERGAAAVLVSVACYGRGDPARVATMADWLAERPEHVG
jgi:hypothetical protein